MKANPALVPFNVLGGHIVGDENNAGRPTDELVFIGFGLRGDQREHRRAVGRGDRDPTVTGLQSGIKCYLKPELINEESQALILISDENLNGVDTQVAGLAIQADTGQVWSLR